ncbi:MAG: ABC transporter ATP-binding protein [Candidatus Methanomethylophilaceae archaeon]|nr:ABC transporter ATP-binding protein [Candidatus Methanomethylophilaceae archaeon]
MNAADRIQNLRCRKIYGDFTAVNGLNLKIEKNSFTGLLGPNGAGKSTSLKILTNLITATSGDVYINGVNVPQNPKEALQGVGTVVETPEFYLYLTPRETFRYMGNIFGMSRERIATETEEILEKVKMTEWADKRLGTFSKGMRQRISLGLSLMNSPEVIILDEPTSGLDPRGMSEMRDILKNVREDNNGLTVLMSSHMMHEVTDLCDRIAMINHGTLLVHDTLENVLGSRDTRLMKVRPLEPANQEMVSKLAALKNIEKAEIEGETINLTLDGGDEEEAELFEQIANIGFRVRSVSVDDNALEAKYLDLIKESR